MEIVLLLYRRTIIKREIESRNGDGDGDGVQGMSTIPFVKLLAGSVAPSKQYSTKIKRRVASLMNLENNVKIYTTYFNGLQLLTRLIKNKKAGSLICIQRPVAFEFYCYALK